MVDAASSHTYVLTVDAVKWAIATLRARKIHPHFLAYLQVHRRWTYDGSFDPRWAELRPLLEMPNGPPKKPNYRPLWNTDSDGSAYWLNGNLAGSFAPKSIRNSFLVADGDYVFPENHAALALDSFLYGDRAPALPLGAYLFRNFGFRISTAEPATGRSSSPESLSRQLTEDPAEYLRQRRVDPESVAGEGPYPSLVEDGWRRDTTSTVVSSSRPVPEDVVMAFRRRFHFVDNDEFDLLFEDLAPSSEFEWFEALTDEEGR